jgi:3-hydroxyisobutyrate dehydrogenase-like beta-hydroxyacid dehydrogenase
VAVLGLGEAGSLLAADLVAAGARVRGYDPAVEAPAGVIDCRDHFDAVSGSDVVFSVNSASDALDAMRAGISALGPGAVWADLNTSSAGLKRCLEAVAAWHGGMFSDVAIMAPVPGKGLAVPMRASGPGANCFAEMVVPLGADVEVLDAPVGSAATRKLLRSVFYKGLAATVLEALWAAEAAGEAPWMREHIAQQLEAADRALIRRLEEGTYRHAGRRTEEMTAASELLVELGVPPRVSTASLEMLRDLQANERAAGRP